MNGPNDSEERNWVCSNCGAPEGQCRCGIGGGKSGDGSGAAPRQS